jgi:hypothetical protein
MKSVPFLTRTGFAICIAMVTSAAFANCRPVIDAYEKSGKQKRTAMYGDAPTAPLTTPMHKWINEDNMMGGAASSLRSGEKKGEIRCTAQGSGDYRGAKANKFEVESSVGKSVTKELIWIDVASGMPVLVQNPKYGTSMAFLYGDAVK